MNKYLPEKPYPKFMSPEHIALVLKRDAEEKKDREKADKKLLRRGNE